MSPRTNFCFYSAFLQARVVGIFSTRLFPYINIFKQNFRMKVKKNIMIERK